MLLSSTNSRSFAPLESMTRLEQEITVLREAMFALTDTARQLVPFDHTLVHVHLQSAANELGEAERMLQVVPAATG